MFTKKHFKAIAEVIRNAKALNTPDDIAHAFAAMLAKQNPRFDLARFLTACGVDPS